MGYVPDGCYILAGDSNYEKKDEEKSEDLKNSSSDGFVTSVDFKFASKIWSFLIVKLDNLRSILLYRGSTFIK